MQQSLQEASGFARQNSSPKLPMHHQKLWQDAKNTSKPIALAPQESGFASSAMLGTL
jgi:hypothetical protein